MANAYIVNDHSLVINVRSGFLTYGRAIGRFAHACREKNQTEHIKYLNKNPTTINRYKLLSEFNGNGNMRDANSKDDELHNMAFVKKLLKGFQDSFKEDYTKQSYTQKRQGKDIVIRRTWRKDMASFCEVIITFGTDREKELKEGLNDEESKFINENIQMDRVMRFVNAYCAKYGAKCLLVAEHNDEKTKHYHIIFTNYNFEKHANLRFSGRSKTAKFGKDLQDMGAEAFEGQVLRGKSSKNRHNNLTQMHQIASEYKSEQELKEKIQKLIEAEANKYMQKKEPLLGDEYFRLEPNEKRALIVGLRNSVFEQMQESITITSDEQLKEKVELLAWQVTEQNKIIEEDKKKSLEVLKEKEQLEKELDDLKETKAEQDKEITHLKNRVKAHTNQQIKIDEQSALIKSKDKENQSLTRKSESLQKENIRLRDMIVNEMPELRGKFTKDDALMEMG